MVDRRPYVRDVSWLRLEVLESVVVVLEALVVRAERPAAVQTYQSSSVVGALRYRNSHSEVAIINLKRKRKVEEKKIGFLVLLQKDTRRVIYDVRSE